MKTIIAGSKTKEFPNKKVITIHFDFTNGKEISYMEGKNNKDSFSTNCLDFFNMQEECDDVMVVRKDGKRISRKNIHLHSEKEIRDSHNIHKMLVAGAFKWI